MSTPTGEEHGAANPEPTESPKRRGRVPADSFPNRLVLARRLAGLTIREAAAQAGVNYGSWSNWENGKRPVDILDTANRISEALDIDHEWLLFGGALAPARGVPVTKRAIPAPAVRAEEDRLAYSARTERPPAGGPKGRGDHTHPMSGLGSGRRPVRVGSARAGVAGNHG